MKETPSNGAACQIVPLSTAAESPRRTATAKGQLITKNATVPLTSILPCSKQIRREIQLDSIRELAASVKQHGLIEPLVVRRTDAGLELVCGYRRYAAARAAKLTEVPVHIREIADQDVLIIALSENIHRRDMSPIEEAEGYKAVIDAGRVKNQAELAKVVGVTQGRISQMLAILELPEAAREAFITAVITNGKPLTEWHARVLRKIEDPKKQVEMARVASAKGLTAKELEERVEEVEAASKGSPKRPVVRRMKWTRLDSSRYCRTKQGLKIEVQGKSRKELLEHLEELVASIKEDEGLK